MQTQLLKEINSVLKGFPQYWNGETLKRSEVITAIENKEPLIIKALASNEKLKQQYSTDIDGILLFDFAKLINLIQYKEYWKDSFTKYKNKIGLTSNGNYLIDSGDIVLDFPFKDCMLEGGMSRSEIGKNEVFYNEIIAADEIDRLKQPKVLVNAKRYSAGGVEDGISKITLEDNLIIKGNNLLALHSLKKRYEGQIKLIYIDPPYNTGSDEFMYNDKFSRSTWLTFMKNRLEIARDLLNEQGVIVIQCDYNEDGYLRVLSDEVFGSENFLANIAVRSSTPSGTKTAHKNTKIIKQKDTIFVYKKKSVTLNPQYIPRQNWDKHYTEYLYKTESGEWALKKLKDVLIEEGIDIPIADLNPTDKKINEFINKHKENICRLQSHKNEKVANISRNKFQDKIYENYVDGELEGLYYNGQVITLIKSGLKPVIVNKSSGEYWSMLLCDFWSDIDFQNTQNEGGVSFPTGKKPEALLKRIIDLTTNPKDIVLDYHLGSGTTAAVAHKTGRKYIGIEQMDYIETLAVKRLQNVIQGDNSGISKAIDWQGGGSFVYCELAKLNQSYVDSILRAESTEQLNSILDVMQHEAYLNYQIELENLLKSTYEVDGVEHEVEFSQLSLAEQKELLIALLDKNQLYVNLSEIDDVEMKISDTDKKFTQSFYQLEI
ncbi:site-specific DNA-methyltransferase [[Pasteurella] aerogenes]|uniref:DNA methyltransferase n=1 Tax=Mannheimia cairinae TaxID=3025936 RepID=UPI00220A780D|nr:site-specific DNA-methyltransferase [Mannheimia cairinae]MDD0826312.1 site-specific DNA-methyltransferase [Mannheimia cairinae]UWZ92799.1 site-specific DNA-methyltransferase [[Pasteurella] aerogenes]